LIVGRGSGEAGRAERSKGDNDVAGARGRLSLVLEL